MTIEAVLEEREKTHGLYSDVAMVSQKIKRVLRGSPNWESLTASQKESLDMISNKLARITCGNSEEIDHWLDCSGYATLIVKQLEK